MWVFHILAASSSTYYQYAYYWAGTTFPRLSPSLFSRLSSPLQATCSTDLMLTMNIPIQSTHHQFPFVITIGWCFDVLLALIVSKLSTYSVLALHVPWLLAIHVGQGHGPRCFELNHAFASMLFRAYTQTAWLSARVSWSPQGKALLA